TFLLGTGDSSHPRRASMFRSRTLTIVAALAVAALVAVPAPGPVQAQDKEKDKKADADMKKRTEESIERGLEYLKKTQAQDGHWEAQGGQYPTTMTALAGMCFLM